MNTKEILIDICNSPYEAVCDSETHKTIISLMKPLCDEIYVDNLGSIICHINKEGKKHVVLSAHCDKIAMVVTAIDKDTGMLKIDKSGGVDLRTFTASRVRVLGSRVLKGCVTSIPPHLMKGDRTVTPSVDDLYIDCGLSYEEISGLVKIGDRVEYDSSVIPLLNDRFAGAYMDNSAGCAAVIKACERLKKENGGNRITAVFTTREETGKGGATASFYRLQPDYAFITDVSFATAPSIPKEMSSPVGSGGMICISPILQKEMSYHLIKTAEENTIPYTTEVMASRTMTDSDVVVISGKGIKTGLVSIPLLNMHTPVETLDINDVDAVADILFNAAKGVE